MSFFLDKLLFLLNLIVSSRLNSRFLRWIIHYRFYSEWKKSHRTIIFNHFLIALLKGHSLIVHFLHPIECSAIVATSKTAYNGSRMLSISVILLIGSINIIANGMYGENNASNKGTISNKMNCHLGISIKVFLSVRLNSFPAMIPLFHDGQGFPKKSQCLHV